EANGEALHPWHHSQEILAQIKHPLRLCSNNPATPGPLRRRAAYKRSVASFLHQSFGANRTKVRLPARRFVRLETPAPCRPTIVCALVRRFGRNLTILARSPRDRDSPAEV